MYVKLNQGRPELATLAQLRRRHPNVSLPGEAGATEEAALAALGVFPLAVGDKPVFDPMTEVCTEGAITLVDGVWTRAWQVTRKDGAEAAAALRRRRNALLAQSDWVTIRARELGQELPRVWFDYRGALRRLPEQSGFPFAVHWPDPPE